MPAFRGLAILAAIAATAAADLSVDGIRTDEVSACEIYPARRPDHGMLWGGGDSLMGSSIAVNLLLKGSSGADERDDGCEAARGRMTCLCEAYVGLGELDLPGREPPKLSSFMTLEMNMYPGKQWRE